MLRLAPCARRRCDFDRTPNFVDAADWRQAYHDGTISSVKISTGEKPKAKQAAGNSAAVSYKNLKACRPFRLPPQRARIANRCCC